MDGVEVPSTYRSPCSQYRSLCGKFRTPVQGHKGLPIADFGSKATPTQVLVRATIALPGQRAMFYDGQRYIKYVDQWM
jgi:hypothetical protein